MSKVVSIDIGRDFSYMIIMSKDKIMNINCIPQDYRANDILNLISFCVPIYEEDIICYDGNGFGVMLTDAIINNEDFMYKENTRSMNVKDVVSTGSMLNRAKEILPMYKENITLPGFEFVEFQKLCKEINNLEIKKHPSGLRLDRKDINIGLTRAICFLNGLYMLENSNHN